MPTNRRNAVQPTVNRLIEQFFEPCLSDMTSHHMFANSETALNKLNDDVADQVLRGGGVL